MKHLAIFLCVLTVQQLYCAGQTMHVQNSVSFRNVIQEVNAGSDISEIVLAEGTYRVGVVIKSNPDTGKADMPLTIRAADGAKVTFVGSTSIVSWEPYGDAPGIYTATVSSSRNEPPKVWNPVTRVRYRRAATPESVEKFPSTYHHQDNRLVIHTPDGSEPSNDTIRVSRFDYGLRIMRSNVTVRNLHFRDFLVREKWSNAITAGGNRIRIENCSVSNASLGIIVEGSSNKVRNCRIDDTGGGIYINGINTTIEGCRLFKRRDGFIVPMYAQDDSGIQFYHPGRGGKITGNLVVGFKQGIFIKAEAASYIVENNTLVGQNLRYGFTTTHWRPKYRFQYNIVTGFNKPTSIRGLKKDEGIDHNLYWAKSTAGYEPIGPHDIVADPKFAAQEWEDYRLQADSPALNVQGNKTIGAFAVVSEDETPVESSRTWHVQVDGINGRSGDQEEPLQTIQHAIDRARPGDTVLVHPGIYPSAVSIRRGGTKERPIVLKSVEKWGAVLDSNRQADIMIDIENAPFIEIHDFEVRWFNVTGIRITKSPNASVNGCRIWNDGWYGGWPTGYAIRAQYSPHLTVHNNVMFRLDYGAWVYQCPNSTLTQNTGVGNLHATIALLYSTENSICRNNSMTFSGSDAIKIIVSKDLKRVEPSFKCDFNNYAATLRPLNDGRAYDSIEPRPEESFLKYGTKAVAAFTVWGQPQQRARTMKEWRRLTGLDKHSIFENPKHVNVKERDLRLEPDSPNIGAGADGATIGALDTSRVRHESAEDTR